jgi:hypothetical protein
MQAKAHSSGPLVVLQYQLGQLTTVTPVAPGAPLSADRSRFSTVSLARTSFLFFFTGHPPVGARGNDFPRARAC